MAPSSAHRDITSAPRIDDTSTDGDGGGDRDAPDADASAARNPEAYPSTALRALSTTRAISTGTSSGSSPEGPRFR